MTESDWVEFLEKEFHGPKPIFLLHNGDENLYKFYADRDDAIKEYKQQKYGKYHGITVVSFYWNEPIKYKSNYWIYLETTTYNDGTVIPLLESGFSFPLYPLFLERFRRIDNYDPDEKYIELNVKVYPGGEDSLIWKGKVIEKAIY